MVILHKGNEFITLFYFRFVYETKLGRSWHSLQSSLFLITQCFSTDTMSDKDKDESAETVLKPYHIPGME